MKNSVTLIGQVVGQPKTRTFESRAGEIEIVSLWLSIPSGDRFDRITVEVSCPKARRIAKTMAPDIIAEVHGELRHDRWKAKASGQWTGKIYVAVDPGQGVLRSQGKGPRPDAIASAGA